ncbi:7977_t:CDS:2, partial [Racocetra persica]
MSTKLQNKIYKFLTTAEECQINATSVIYLGLKKDRWIPQNELRSIIDRVVISASNVIMEGSPRHSRILQISSQKPVRQMKPTLPSRIKDMCNEFVSSFSSHDDSNGPPEKLTHDGTWKEYEEELSCVVNEIFSTIKDVWNNPALNSDVAGTLNEGTYQSTVIVPFIRAVLKNLPFGSSSFISTSERESIASADRKDGQMGRRPDIMFIVNHLDMLFEIMYVECSRLVCIQKKKDDDDIKLWRECNDGMYYTRKTLSPEKEQFGIVGIQIAEDTLHLNVLIRDKMNVHRYYNIESAKIPVQESDENTRVAKLEAENTKLKQIIEEIANLRIENTKLKQIIKQNRTTNVASSVTPQMPIPSSINGHSDKDDITNSVNLKQAQ